MIDMMVNLLYSLSPFVLLVTISHSVKKGEKNLSLYLASRSHDMKTIPSRIPTPSSCHISAQHRCFLSSCQARPTCKPPFSGPLPTLGETVPDPYPPGPPRLTGPLQDRGRRS